MLSAALLIALGIPFASIKFMPVDASVLPASASAHQVDQRCAPEFPPNRTTPLEVVVGAPAGSPECAPSPPGSATAGRVRGRARPAGRAHLR